MLHLDGNVDVYNQKSCLPSVSNMFLKHHGFDRSVCHVHPAQFIYVMLLKGNIFFMILLENRNHNVLETITK
jgi:hypothetical protein